jgi:type VII secretion protein EccE
MAVRTEQPAQPKSSGPATRTRIRARRRSTGAALLGIPVANIVVIEVGLTIALILAVINPILLPGSGAVVLVALIVALSRRRGRWFTNWFGLLMEYRGRSHTRVCEPADEDEPEPADETIIGPENHRVGLLRLVVDDLAVARSQDHDRNPVGMAWHDGKWTAVLMVEQAGSLLTEVGKSPNLPLSVLVPCLEDRGVTLDSIRVIWHCYSGSVALPHNSPALGSYLELLGPTPAAARRATWIAVRLDPQLCAKAIGERGGGILGAHRALIGALSRVHHALELQGVSTRPLGPDELLQEAIASAELQSVLGTQRAVGLKERWSSVTAGGVGHSSFAITRWPSHISSSLNALTGVRALSSSIALAITPSGEEGEVGLRGVVRVSARIPSELDAAQQRLQSTGHRLGLGLSPLRGLQLAGLAATLPLGGTA